jgi:hypothetical protein
MRRAPKKKLLIVVLGIVVFGYLLLSAPFYVRNAFTGGYWRFLKRDQRYYMEFARACDSIMAHYPAGTNVSIAVATTDPSLPKIIRALRPTRIESQSNRVWMLIGRSRAGFGIAWEPEPDGQTNTWAINTFVESLVRTPYVETRR